jgi:hypothetical protein
VQFRDRIYVFDGIREPEEYGSPLPPADRPDPNYTTVPTTTVPVTTIPVTTVPATTSPATTLPSASPTTSPTTLPTSTTVGG